MRRVRTGFNSLFEMQLGVVKETKPETPVEVSILYLRCPGAEAGEREVATEAYAAFQFSI